MMDRTRISALCGSLLLLVGLFAPVVSTPPSSSIAYWQSGIEPAFIVFIMVATALLALGNRLQLVFWAGLAAVGIIGFSFLRVLYALMVSRRHIADGTANPDTGLAEAVFSSAHLMWGWAALVLGAALIIFAGWKSRRTPE